MVSKSILNHYYIVQHVQRGRSVMTFKVLMRSILGHWAKRNKHRSLRTGEPLLGNWW